MEFAGRELKLPTLTPEEAWIDRGEEKDKIKDKVSDEIKNLLYLPSIAYKTAIYAHENKLSDSQKEYLVLLFIGESDNAFNLVVEQALIVVGNAPADRIAHVNDFQIWKKQLIKLLKESLKCITKEQWLEELKEINNSMPSERQLTSDEKENVEKKLRSYFQKAKYVFDKGIYFEKYSEFTRDAMDLLRRISVMCTITMENPECMLRGLKNIGKLPDNLNLKVASGEKADIPTNDLDTGKYSDKLFQIAKETEKILDWNKIRLSLLVKAVRFLINEHILKNKLKHIEVFGNIDKVMDFINNLNSLATGKLPFSNNDIGKYCATLFLAYDFVSDRPQLYEQIKANALGICNLTLDPKPPLFEDFLKNGDNPAQNTKELFINRLNDYLSRVKAYLRAENLLKSESAGTLLQDNLADKNNNTPSSNYISYSPTYPFKAGVSHAEELMMFSKDTPWELILRKMGGSIRLPVGLRKDELKVIDQTVKSKNMGDIKIFLVKNCGYNMQNVCDLSWDDIITALKYNLSSQGSSTKQNGGKAGEMDKIDLIIKALKDWRETADKFGVDSPQAKEKGAIAMPLLFENRELLPESNQRFQLRGLEDRFTIDEIKTMNDGSNCDFYADKNFIADLEKLSAGGEKAGKTKPEQEAKSIKEPPELNDAEQCIIEALGTNTLIGEKLARKAGYPYNSNFKSTLARLRKRAILGNKAPGYFLEPKYLFLLNKSDQGQDKGQD